MNEIVLVNVHFGVSVLQRAFMQRLHVGEELDDKLWIVKTELLLRLGGCISLSSLESLRVYFLDQIELLLVKYDLTAGTWLLSRVCCSIAVSHHLRRLFLK